MKTEERDEVAVLVRLAGPSGLTDPIALLDKDWLARVRTAVHGAWRDEYVDRPANKVKARRRLFTVVLVAAAASIIIAVATWVRCAHRHRRR